MLAPERTAALIVTVGGRACAVPLHYVAETMRPLPIEPVAGTPSFVRGLSVIRGEPIPVVDLRALLENGENSATLGRFVTVKLKTRKAAIGVDAVVGLRHLDSARFEELPPILGNVAADLIEALATRDGELLIVLRGARIVPDEVWATLARGEATR